MAERRSLGAAMAMTPAQWAFVEGRRETTTHPAPEAESPPAAPTTRGAAPDVGGTAAGRPPAAGRTRRPRHPPEPPAAADLLDQVLVPITIRLPHRTAQALRRAALEQRLHQAKPDTQQQMVEQAIGDWLVRRGFKF